MVENLKIWSFSATRWCGLNSTRQGWSARLRSGVSCLKISSSFLLSCVLRKVPFSGLFSSKIATSCVKIAISDSLLMQLYIARPEARGSVPGNVKLEMRFCSALGIAETAVRNRLGNVYTTIRYFVILSGTVRPYGEWPRTSRPRCSCFLTRVTRDDRAFPFSHRFGVIST